MPLIVKFTAGSFRIDEIFIRLVRECPCRNIIVRTQEFRREGWTETAFIICKLSKST